MSIRPHERGRLIVLAGSDTKGVPPMQKNKFLDFIRFGGSHPF